MSSQRASGFGRWGRAAALAVAVMLASSAALAGGADEAVAGLHGGSLTAGTISTVAGGVGGPGPATRVSVVPCGVTYGGGRLYVADQGDSGVSPSGGTVREVTPGTDQLTTVAGTGAFGPGGLRGPATSAWVDTCSVARDHSGNLLMPNSARIDVVAASTGRFYGQAMTAGHIYAIAGNGTPGFSGNNGLALRAEIDPTCVTVDAAGNVLIGDGNRLRVVAARSGTFYGRPMTALHIYWLAGNGSSRARQVHSGVPATKSAVSPLGVAVDAAGNPVIANGSGEVIQVVAAGTGTFYGRPMTAGYVYTVAGDGTQGFSGDGGPATSAELGYPTRVSVDAAGNLVESDLENNRVRVVAAGTGTFYGRPMTAGDIYTVAGDGTGGASGDGGPATAAAVGGPDGTTVDGSGNLVIASYFNVRVVAAATGTFYGQAMTARHIYTIAGNGRPTDSGFGGPASRAELFQPQDAAASADGTLAIADYANSRVLVVPARSATLYGRPMTAGHIYDVAGNGTAGYSGDRGPGYQAEVNFPPGVAIDSAGNVLIADSSNRVRVVAAATGTFYGQAMTAGDIYTIAGNGGGGFSGDGGPALDAQVGPISVALDGSGNVLITDGGNDRIRVVAERTGRFYGQAMTAGDIYTVAGNGTRGYSGDGGPATEAEFLLPQGVAADGSGNILVADSANYRIRLVAGSTGTFYGQAMTAGHIYTIAGDGTQGYAGDGGPATAAELEDPAGVTVDNSGNVLIADYDSGTVRAVAASTGTFYGRSMVAGDIYTIAGDGTGGFSGDGGPATAAELQLPSSVSVDSAGDVFIADLNGRIREVSG